MNELLAAAKAVIDGWDNYGCTTQAKIQLLRAAVERTENLSPDFYKWWDEISNNTLSQETFDAAISTWTAAQQAERERCREIVITMGGPDVPELLKQIDSGEE